MNPIEMNRRTAMIGGAGLFVAGFGTAATAQAAYPDRPVKIVVSFPAGGTGDAVARLVSTALASTISQPLVIENIGGAAGAVAAGQVARARPDGYTLLFSAISVFAHLPFLTQTPFDAIEDFTPIAMIGDSQRVLAARPDAPFKTVPELIAYAKANPGKVRCGSSGNGSTPHIITEVFAKAAGVEILHVPYKGAAPALADLLGGHVDIMIDTVVIPSIAQGKLRALAAVGEKRLEKFPDLPTLDELGFKNVRASGWTGFFAPAKTPDAVIQYWASAIQPLFSKPEFLERIKAANVAPRFASPAEFKAYIREDHTYFGRVIREHGIRP